MTHLSRSLRSGFLASVEAFPDRPALECEGAPVTYRQLHALALSIAASLDGQGHDEPRRLTAVLGDGSTETYAGMLGALFRGHGYVPLNTLFPAMQLQYMVEKAQVRSLVVDNGSVGRLEELLDGLDTSLTVVLPGLEADELRARWPGHAFIGRGDLIPGDGYTPGEVTPEDVAYIMFTSGSTGKPKGVQITHASINAFIDFSVDRYRITPEDRFSQVFQITFDISVFDLFVAWERGACVCYPTKAQMFDPKAYVQDSRLTIWYANPSMLFNMKAQGMLEPGAFPTVRVSLYVGEALPADITEMWAAAAPNSLVENLYGPTELTLTCTYYTWEGARSMAESLHGIVPIGFPHPGMTVLIVDENLAEVAPGEDGELLMAGHQMALGYLDDPEKTAAAFMVPPGKSELYYRTGDRVRRPATPEEPIQYLGRNDHQVQVRGARVELGEVEVAIREEGGVDVVVVIGWPMTERGADGLIAFVSPLTVSQQDLRQRLAARLPRYALPRKFIVVEKFPLNSNGKIDRHALKRLLPEPKAA